MVKPRHLLGIDDLTDADISQILSDAAAFSKSRDSEVKLMPALRGKVVVNIFYEPSTRTRVSFEIAAKRLSAEVVNVDVSSSSVAKGESLSETGRTLESLGADAIVIRHSEAGAPASLAASVGCGVINAGDGAREHPTQALADVFCLQQRLETLNGQRVAIVGDISHSRVARSVVKLFTRMGAEVSLVAPGWMIPPGSLSVPSSPSLDDVIGDLDVLYVLRMQHERHDRDLPSDGYVSRFGVDSGRLAQMKPDAVVMHPGPANLGYEIGPDVATGPRSLMSDQVRSGVSVRMAVLWWVFGQAANSSAQPMHQSTAHSMTAHSMAATPK